MHTIMIIAGKDFPNEKFEDFVLIGQNICGWEVLWVDNPTPSGGKLITFADFGGLPKEFKSYSQLYNKMTYMRVGPHLINKSSDDETTIMELVEDEDWDRAKKQIGN